MSQIIQAKLKLMKKIFLFASLVVSVALVSCNDGEPNNDDVVKQPSKDGAIQVTTETKQVGDSVLMTINYDVYKNNQLITSKVVKQMLPSLGTTQAESDEDENGDTQKVTVPKLYEFYVTVK